MAQHSSVQQSPAIVGGTRSDECCANVESLPPERRCDSGFQSTHVNDGRAVGYEMTAAVPGWCLLPSAQARGAPQQYESTYAGRDQPRPHWKFAGRLLLHESEDRKEDPEV